MITLNLHSVRIPSTAEAGGAWTVGRRASGASARERGKGGKERGRTAKLRPPDRPYSDLLLPDRTTGLLRPPDWARTGVGPGSGLMAGLMAGVGRGKFCVTFSIFRYTPNIDSSHTLIIDEN